MVMLWLVRRRKSWGSATEESLTGDAAAGLFWELELGRRWKGLGEILCRMSSTMEQGCSRSGGVLARAGSGRVPFVSKASWQRARHCLRTLAAHSPHPLFEAKFVRAIPLMTTVLYSWKGCYGEFSERRLHCYPMQRRRSSRYSCRCCRHYRFATCCPAPAVHAGFYALESQRAVSHLLAVRKRWTQLFFGGNLLLQRCSFSRGCPPGAR